MARSDFAMHCHGASELEHTRFTQFNLSALLNREKSFMSRLPVFFLLGKSSLFYFGGFIIPNKVERDFVYFRTEVLRGVHDTADKNKF